MKLLTRRIGIVLMVPFVFMGLFLTNFVLNLPCLFIIFVVPLWDAVVNTEEWIRERWEK